MNEEQYKIEALFIYPVKSLGGIEVSSLEFDVWGPKFDRRWMIIDEDGLFLNQRTCAKLATIKMELTRTHLIFKHPQGQFSQPLDYIGKPCAGTVWKHTEMMDDCGDDIAEFLSSYLDQKCRLVGITNNHQRLSSGHETHSISLVDSQQVLVATTESLDWLNQELIAKNDQAVTIDRFRANIIISGGSNKFYENSWQELNIGEIKFHRAKACERCMVITMDQNSGEHKSSLPLTILAKHHRGDKGTGAAFGTYFNATNLGSIDKTSSIHISSLMPPKQ